MLPYYEPTETELLICDLYQAFGIKHPYELDIDLIASIWGADIIYYNGKPKSHWEDWGSVIFLNKNTSLKQRRADFFHELAHIVRHEGNQDDLPELFVDLQEIQASNFCLIASIPYYLLPTPLDMTWSEYIGLLSEEFRVPIVLAADRAEQITSRFHEEYHSYREDVDAAISAMQISAALYNSKTAKSSSEAERLLQQLKYQVYGKIKR
ncbi:Zn-dependent peptidase ImmA (M78 family) [Paenibacillus sp. W4I10]|uniref:ImmA/IrrE family metallo-endopeptidase n=1 Tax=Paenibacillus sp. W4I10 TaxID=3042298 RepID=UPI00277F7320|nr:ImmA/IrrE family metallo-endopeptidase [Paenibacillus sp. W4I10]MDQ0719754.1 Zn-dependent peptidase ImmA (M78 family) [Paenibacillus sp. W4I10]